MHLRRRLTLGVPEILGALDDAYLVADEAPESPRRRTLVELTGTAIRMIESADDDWDRGLAGSSVRTKLGVALECVVFVDLLAEVVVRDGGGHSTPPPAELELHDRVREMVAGVRPLLVMAEDTAAEEAAITGRTVHDDPPSRSDT